MAKVPSEVFIAMQENKPVEMSYDAETWRLVSPENFNRFNPFTEGNAYWRVRQHPAVKHYQNIKASKHASAATYYDYFEAGFDAGVEHTVKQNG